MKLRTNTGTALQLLADAGLDLFTVEDLRTTLGLTPAEAKGLAHRLARAGVALRLRRGLYALLKPADWGRKDFLGNWYLAAAHLAAPHPYFLAYYTAMEIHRMLQHPLRTVFVATTRQRPTVHVEPVRFRFVTLDERRFFGFEDVELEPGHPVRVADLERTFLDCVDRPDLCGGIEEVFRGFDRRNQDLDADRLVRYVARLDRPTTTKRLGLLLELVGLGDAELLLDLERLAGRLKRYLPLVKGRPTEDAERNKRWELLVNTDVQKLFRARRS